MASPLTGVAALVMSVVASCSAAPGPRAVISPQHVSAPSLHSQVPQTASDYQFDSHGVARVSAKQLGKSWHHGCPVPPRDLRALQVRFWGFDRLRHTGVLIINVSAVHAVR